MQSAAGTSFDLTTRISSSATVFHKRLFPFVWFGVTVVFASFAVHGALTKGFARPGIFAFLVVPVVMGIIGQFVMRKLIWDLVDEVRDGGDFLIVRKGLYEERVSLTNVMNVSFSYGTSPPRVTLRLVKPGRFGADVAFIPIRERPFSLSARNPMVDELMVRVDKARQRRIA